MIQERFEYKHIAGAATTLVKSGLACLHSIVVNKAVAGGTITIYDGLSASGAVVGVIATTTSEVPLSARYDVKLATGLCIVTTGAVDLTVSFG